MMAVLVDTNIILDVVTDDPKWASWSINALRECESRGLMVNPMIYTELCYNYDSADEVDFVIRRFGFVMKEISRQGLFRASKAFGVYKQGGGERDSLLPDFFIGGHADAAGMSILTRDTRRYRTYFPNVELICPS